MAGLLLFVPGNRERVDVVELAVELGLEDWLDGQDEKFAPCLPMLDRGPTGEPGTLFVFHGPEDRMPLPYTCNMSEQEWHEAAFRKTPERELARGRYWFGWWKARPPRPIDLQRKKLRDGVEMKLDDGQLWTLPVLRQLPMVLGLDPATGELTERFRVERYRALWERTIELVQKLQQGIVIDEETGKATFTFDKREHFDFGAQLLAVNYRLNADVASALGIFGTYDISDLPYRAGGFEEKKS